MRELYEELFRAMNQFRKLKFGEILPEISKTDFVVMISIQKKGKEGKITISELAANARILPSAVSRTLKGLEERGYVERTINKEDRRNTYVELTQEGKRITLQTKQIMSDFGQEVMGQLKEEEVCLLVSYLNRIYEIAQKEIENRKWTDRKEEENE